jgi:hypothetical protein
MKNNNRLLAALGCATLLMSFRLTGNCQANETTVPKEKVVALVKRIEAQQAQIEANQIKIESKLAEVHELVRQTWVFARRASK